MTDPQLLAGVVILALASAVVGGAMVAVLVGIRDTGPAGNIDRREAQAALNRHRSAALSELGRKGGLAAAEKRKAANAAHRQRVLEVAAQMRKDIAAKTAPAENR